MNKNRVISKKERTDCPGDAAMSDKQGWIRVEDDMPKQGQQIFYTDGIYILWGQYGGVYRGITLIYADGRLVWWTIYTIESNHIKPIGEVTHWMPRLEPPPRWTMNKFCTLDNELLTERPSAQTSGEPDYKCPACGRVYEMRYPASAAGGCHLELVYDPERSGPNSPWVGGAADG